VNIKRFLKSEDNDSFRQLIMMAIIIMVVGFVSVVLLSGIESGSTEIEKIWTTAECDNSAYYEYEPLILRFKTIGKARYGDYNTTADPIRIASYKVTLNNNSRTEEIAGKRFETEAEYILPYEEVELEFDKEGLAMFGDFPPGEYELTLLIEPHNKTKYPKELYKFDVSFLVEAEGEEFLSTIYYFFIPPVYLFASYPVNRFVNKHYITNIGYMKYFTLGTWFYVLKLFWIWFFFMNVTNTKRKQKKNLKKLRKQAKRERKKREKLVEKVEGGKIHLEGVNTSQCKFCKCFLKPEAVICPRCEKPIA